MTKRSERLQSIEQLQSQRGSKVIAYLTTTRDGVDISMAMDVIPTFDEHLSQLRFEDNEPRHIDVLIHSNGGDGTVPWRLITLLRGY